MSRYLLGSVARRDCVSREQPTFIYTVRLVSEFPKRNAPSSHARIVTTLSPASEGNCTQARRTGLTDAGTRQGEQLQATACTHRCKGAIKAQGEKSKGAKCLCVGEIVSTVADDAVAFLVAGKRKEERKCRMASVTALKTSRAATWLCLLLLPASGPKSRTIAPSMVVLGDDDSLFANSRVAGVEESSADRDLFVDCILHYVLCTLH